MTILRLKDPIYTWGIKKKEEGLWTVVNYHSSGLVLNSRPEQLGCINYKL